MKDENGVNPAESFNNALSGLSQSGVPIWPDRQEEPVCHFREALMDEILVKHPGLTRAELSEQMAYMGF